MEWTKEHQQYKAYLPLPEKIKEYATLEISVNYSKGGPNYFTGSYNKRGYRLAFKPCTVCQGSVSYTMMSADRKVDGYYILIEETIRYNEKRLTEIAMRIAHSLETLVKAYSEDNVDLIQSIAKGGELVDDKRSVRSGVAGVAGSI